MLLDDRARDWAPRRADALEPLDFADVIALGPTVSEFVLLGAGPTQVLPPRAVREAIQAAGLGLEFMSTEAAARTYNVLASEGRRFAVALIAV